MATGQERQEPEIFAQEVQEGKEAAGRHIHSIRISSNIDPEKAWLYDLNQENFKKLTPEQQEEWLAHQKEAMERFPEALERMENSMKSIILAQGESIKEAHLILADMLGDMRKMMSESFKSLFNADVLEYTKEVLQRLSEETKETLQTLSMGPQSA